MKLVISSIPYSKKYTIPNTEDIFVNTMLKNLAMIPARSGSKSIIDKNIKYLNGKPLLAYSIEAAIKSGMFRTVMVSTDSEQYAEIAKEYGAEVPFLRSKENSSDSAGSWDAVGEVLERYKQTGEHFDTICLLQPTSPLRTSEDISKSYDLLLEKSGNAITSVCECDHPMEYMMTLPDDGSLTAYRSTKIDLPRQKLPTYYRLNGAIFIRRVEYSDNNTVKTLSDPEYAYIMKKHVSVDIDTQDDFEYAQYLMQQYGRLV